MPSPGCFGLGPGTGSQRDSGFQAKRRWKGPLSEGSNPGAFQNRRNSHNTPSSTPALPSTCLPFSQRTSSTCLHMRPDKEVKKQDSLFKPLIPELSDPVLMLELARAESELRGQKVGDLASTRSSPTTHRGSATNSRFPALAFPWADHRRCPPELTSVEAARKCRAHFGRWDPWG